MALQWRAICPACGHRVPRTGMLSETARCAACSASIQQNPAWNRVFTTCLSVVALMGSVTILLLVRQTGSTALTVAAVLAFLVLLVPLSALAWPYCTKYDPRPEPK